MKKRTNMKEKRDKGFPADHLVRIIYGACMLVILMLCFFFAGIHYVHKCDTALNLLLFPAGAAGAVFLYALFLNMGRKKGSAGATGEDHTGPDWYILAFAAAFLLFQVKMSYAYCFRAGWEVRNIMTIVEGNLGNGSQIAEQYLSWYPNNLVLCWIFTVIGKAARAFSPECDILYSLIFFQCVVCAATGILIYGSVRNMGGGRANGLLAYVLFLLLLGFSPWVSVPYSDASALCIPALVIYLYTLKKRGLIHWFLIGAIGYIGLKIKPQTFICVIAIVLAECADVFFSAGARKEKYKKAGISAASLAGGILAGYLLAALMGAQLGYQLTPGKAMGMSHYFMMGMNAETMGTYSEADVHLSFAVDDPDIRKAVELEIAADRISEMGLSGLIRLFHEKILIVFNDGTFAWGREGTFFRVLYEKEGSWADFWRNVFYCGDIEGAYFKIWNNLEQCVWITVLFFSGAAVFFGAEKGKLAMMLTVTGLFVFELLFEARARYLYTCVPVFIMLSVFGLSGIISRFRKKT